MYSFLSQAVFCRTFVKSDHAVSEQMNLVLNLRFELVAEPSWGCGLETWDAIPPLTVAFLDILFTGMDIFHR